MTRRRYYLVADTPESRPCSNYLRDRYREAPALYLRGDPEKPYVSSNCEMPPIEPGLMVGIGESDAARRTKQYRSHLIGLKLFRQMREENKSRPGAPQAAKGGHPSPAPPLPMRPDRQTERPRGTDLRSPGPFTALQPLLAQKPDILAVEGEHPVFPLQPGGDLAGVAAAYLVHGQVGGDHRPLVGHQAGVD